MCLAQSGLAGQCSPGRGKGSGSCREDNLQGRDRHNRDGIYDFIALERVLIISTPMRRIPSGCCARTASGQAAARARRRGDRMKGRSSLLPVGADRHLPGGAVRRPLRPVRRRPHRRRRRASSHRGVLTNLRKPSSLAGLQVRATRAGSWPNVPVSGFAAPQNSSAPRRSDNAVQKIYRPEPEADVE